MPDSPRGLAVRERLARGLLPHEEPPRIWVGNGSGRPCDGCSEPIGHAEQETEIDVVDRTYRFHDHCLTVWRLVREQDRRVTPPRTVNSPQGPPST